MVLQIGVPIKLLHESEGHKLTVELIDGVMYRGMVVDTEDNMNCQLTNVTVIQKNGSQSHLEFVYIRGSKIRYIILPDMLKNAPMIKKFDPQQAKSLPNVSIGLENSQPVGRGRGRGRGGRGGDRARVIQ